MGKNILLVFCTLFISTVHTIPYEMVKLHIINRTNQDVQISMTIPITPTISGITTFYIAPNITLYTTLKYATDSAVYGQITQKYLKVKEILSNLPTVRQWIINEKSD